MSTTVPAGPAAASSLPPGLLGIDLGTASVKVVLVGLDGRLLATAQRSYDVVHPHPGWSESAPETWWLAVVAAVRDVVAAARASPVGIGLSGQMHGVVLAGADRRPLRPAILWSDSRAAQEVRLLEALPEEVRRRLANPLVPGMAGPQLAWLQRHEPDLLARADWALQPKDWLRLQLTGLVATEPSDASATLLWDLAADTWDLPVVAALGLRPDLLPPVVGSAGALAGTLVPAAAAELALPAGLPVAAGGADTAVAMLGTSLRDPGSAQLTIGTGIQVVTPLDALPTPLPLHPTTHTYRGVDATGWYAMAASINGGSTLAWVCRVLGMDWPELYETARLPAYDDDPLFLPHLHGERTSAPEEPLLGAWTHLSPRHDRSRLARSALEGVALAVRRAAYSLPLGDATAPMRLAGGGTVAPAWRQLLADALDRPLHAVDVPGASGLGAALLGARAAGVEVRLPEVTAPAHPTLPDPAATARMDERAERWQRQVEALART